MPDGGFVKLLEGGCAAARRTLAFSLSLGDAAWSFWESFGALKDFCYFCSSFEPHEGFLAFLVDLRAFWELLQPIDQTPSCLEGGCAAARRTPDFLLSIGGCRLYSSDG